MYSKNFNNLGIQYYITQRNLSITNYTCIDIGSSGVISLQPEGKGERELGKRSLCEHAVFLLDSMECWTPIYSILRILPNTEA